MAPGFQPEASSAKSIRWRCERTVFQRRRNDSRWMLSSRQRSPEKGSSKESGVVLMTREGNAEGKGDSARGVTSFCAPCGAKALKGMRRSGADAVRKMSLGSRSRYFVRAIVCRPKPTKCSEGS